MSRGLNKVMLIGNVGIKNDLVSIGSNGKAITLSIATSVSSKDKETGTVKQSTEWHRVVFFDKLAEIVNLYSQKGSKLYVEGYIKSRLYKDKSGSDQKVFEIIATSLNLLDSKSSSNASAKQEVSLSMPTAFDDDLPF